MQVTPHFLKPNKKFFIFGSVFCARVNFSHAIDEGVLNELVGKKVQKALAKEKAKAKHQRVDKSAFFAGLGYSGMFSWNLAYKDSFVLLPHYFSGRLLERKDPSTILNGFNFKVGYISISLLLRLKKMGFGVRGGFQYSYKAGNYMEKDKYQQYLFGVIPIISPVSFFNGGMITMSTYSFFMDFLHNVYENEKFFIGYFIGAGLGGESVTANVLKDFGNILAQLVQFQGYGSLGLRMGDKHHTLELSASIHGDAPSCSLKKLKSCESVRVLQAKIPRGIFESYVTWSADYVYRF
ncbi:outer membrane beta-barrel protein [Helicobacter pylori]|uniref:Outer membrane beta-barrel protein n=1 Tax=Helicobacter pylori TaxID=210 RepID=A0A438PXU9_HELPX|nr:outer membrane beta-barrel protein [Helicobacter pylori]RVY30299.1 outer membrane beta-barrel protein [Helicobacter pylori]